jgi:hypothetical protein
MTMHPSYVKLILSAGAALALAAPGCDTGGGSTGTLPTPSSGKLQAPAEGEGVQYSMKVTIQAGTEFEKCKFIQVGAKDLWVNSAESLYTDGSHHMLVYQTTWDSIPTQDAGGNAILTETADGIFDCTDGVGDLNVSSVIAGAQDPIASTYDFPDGVAIKIAAGSVIILNTHYLNASTKDLEADVYVNLYTIPEAQVKTRAGVLFFYNPFIHAPAGEKFSAERVCPIYKDIKILNAQSHMHARGVGYEAFQLNADLTPKSATPIYTETSWADPVVKVFPNGGLPVAAGEHVKWRCDYHNTGKEDVYQGGSAKDEMCMFVAPYYPYHVQTEYCMQPDAPEDPDASYWFAGGWSVGKGTLSCTESVTQISEQTGFSDEFQEAVTHVCEDHSLALRDATNCMFEQLASTCGTECANLGSQECRGCVESACANQFLACAAEPPCD